MPIKTPFHPRTSELNNNLDWKDWAGYFAADSYNVVNSFEYFAFRHSAGLVDITPLFKYRIIPDWPQNVAYRSFLFRLYFVKE